MVPFVLGLAVLAIALYFLVRLKQKDLGESAMVLGLSVVAKGDESRGTTPEGFDFHQTVVARGVIDGVPAELSVRTVRTKVFRKTRRSPTQMTMLTLRPAQPIAATLRLQPAGMMRGLEQLVQGAPAPMATGDAPFDAAYHVYAAEPTRAIVVLSPELRQALLAFRASVSASEPGSVSNYLTSANLLGTFDVSPDAASYYVYGSPTKTLADHIKRAAPLLARLTGASSSA